MLVLASVFVLVLTLLLAELTSRVFWTAVKGLPLYDASHVLYAFYPEIVPTDREPPAADDDVFDIALLAGSVLHPEWGNGEQELSARLSAALSKRVRVHNLAGVSQTSRDSRIKLASLRDAEFDLVVFYHGINEARANNAPPEIFRSDYSHYSWYKTINALEPYHGTARASLPLTVAYFRTKLQQFAASDRLVSEGPPRKDWIRWGATVRTAESFEENLRAVVEQARSKGARVLLLTFATYVPEDYTRERFDARALDYVEHLTPIEIWGSKDNVLAAVARHNEVVVDVAHSSGAGVELVDQARHLAGVAAYFDDPCHLSDAGAAAFAENLVAAILADR